MRSRPGFLILLLWLAGGLLWSPVQAAHVMAGPAHGTANEMPCAGAEAGSANIQTHCQGNVHDSVPCSCTQACQANGMATALAPARLHQATPTVNVARAGDRLSGFHTSPWRPPSTPLRI
ncbi:MAG: hypothetical protein KFB92_01280 [Alcanivorax sp.]|nr:MAG: hypothetical protein KFB92_01280 [Alcanivorax sp.]